MARFYSVELSKRDADLFRSFLAASGLYYEASGCYNLIHFEVKCLPDQVETVNAFLAL